jgi:TolB protein
MRSAAGTSALLLVSGLAAVCPAQQPDRPLVRLTTDGLLKQRPAWSPDGKWLSFTRHEGATIFVFVRAADGSSERRLTKRTDPEFDAVWSPSGARLALAIDKASPNQGDIEVYTVAPDGDELKAVATTGKTLSHEEWPAWSPDGKQIAFTATWDDNQELYVAQADGSERKRLTSDPAIDAHPCWSPDGKQIVFATSRWGDLELAMVQADGGGLIRLSESRGLDDYPVWSPDGREIAFTSNRDGNLEIYTVAADGKNPRNRTQHAAIDNFPAWTPDGRLTFVSNRDGGFEIYIVAEPRK